MSSIPCSWCGQPASRMYLGRIVRRTDEIGAPFTAIEAPDCYLCPACDALVLAGKPLPQEVATFSVAVKGDGE